MANYKVVNGFTDLEDKKKVYKIGDTYPKELSSVHPKHKRIFIEALEKDEGDADDEQDEEQEKEAIKSELESLGVSFHPNTGLEKLRDKLEEAKAKQEDKE
jgi:hypothetical protein